MCPFKFSCSLSLLILWIGQGAQPTWALESTSQEQCELQFDNGAHLTIPVARTYSAQQRGLMGQTRPGRGLVFLWPDARVRGLWMKNTPIPLSAAWIGEDGRVQAVLDLEPMSTEKRSSYEPAVAVIEVPSGLFSAMAISEDSRVVRASCLTFR